MWIILYVQHNFLRCKLINYEASNRVAILMQIHVLTNFIYGSVCNIISIQIALTDEYSEDRQMICD